jgi:hypothetical protein
MLLIPLQATPNQTLAVTLARQAAQLALRQNGRNIYFDLLLAGSYVVRSRICRDRQRLLLDAKYRGFVGDFLFVDTQGVNNPQFAGLGSRYQLVYLAAGE